MNNRIVIKDGHWSHECPIKLDDLHVPCGERCVHCGGTLFDEAYRYPNLGVEAADVNTISGYAEHKAEAWQ